VGDMRAGAMITLLAGAIAVGAPTALAARSHHGPSPARMTRAVRRAERSANLWATVNICKSGSRRGAIGIRGEMPALGFAARLSMTIQVDYWSSSAQAYEPIPSSTATWTRTLGTFSSGLQQAGARFPFPAHAGKLAGTVNFTWTRGGTVLGTASRSTTAGHPTAAYGSPPHYSAAGCTIS
jgi:hypothetical protein